jgi:hypothetical protein
MHMYGQINAPRFESIAQVRDAVERNQGVLTLPMEVLRDAYGARKLGVHVLTGISDTLRNSGLGHTELPNYQHMSVRVYQLGSPVGRVIRAVEQVGEDHDAVLRQVAANDEKEVLERIRELVCP